MVISMWLLRCLIVLLAFLCKTLDSSILQGPSNVVGIVDANVTLNCRTNHSQHVEWKFTPYNETVLVEESKFPGHHSTTWSSRGYHSLTLEALKFENAGRYVCRVVGTSGGGQDAGSAFVGVVANPPRCTDSATGPLAYNDSVGMECSVTFVGQHNLTLEWLAPDGSVLRRRHYWSGGKVEVARLLLDETVRASSRYNLSTPTPSYYKCRSYFSNWTTHFDDQASNSPEFRRNTCALLLPVPTVLPARVTTDARPLASSTNGLTVVVCLLTGALVVAVIVVISVCVYFKSAVRRGHRQNVIEGRPSLNPDYTSNSAQCDDKDVNATEQVQLISRENAHNARCGAETSGCLPETGGIDIAQVHPVSVQPHSESEQRLPNEESTASACDSADSTPSSSAVHDETVHSDNEMVALHEDPLESAAEDQVGSQTAR